MSLATSRQLPAQKPGRSLVVWIGRPAGEVMARTSGTCAVRDRRMLRQAEQRLGADFDRRARRRRIVDRVAASGRADEFGRREPVEPCGAAS